MANIQDLQSGKTFRVAYHQTVVTTSEKSLKNSATSKANPYLFLNLQNGQNPDISWEMVSLSAGDCLTLNISESLRDADVCLLSQILEANADSKYYLSPKACQGILRRASIRGKELPSVLKTALERQAQSVCATRAENE